MFEGGCAAAVAVWPVLVSLRPGSDRRRSAYKATCDLLGRLRAVVMWSPGVRWSPVRLEAVVTQLVTHGVRPT
jgi:hypothetical protein